MAADDQPRVTSATVDLSNCNRELIQFSNAVQPHAVLVTLEENSGRILQASANLSEVTSGPAAAWIGRNFEDLLAGGSPAVVKEVLGQIPQQQPPLFLMRGAFEKGERNIFVHRNDGVAILELEREAPALFSSTAVLHSRLREGVGYLQQAETLEEVLGRAVGLIAHCTGFERVMAYKFLEDGSGHVVAEETAPGREKFLGLHYPAPDIPLPARRLFALTWLQHLPDAAYTPVPLEPAVNPVSKDALDLSYAFSRSVNAMYRQYLKSMGVQATMVFTLLKKGVLWGLISCMHHSAPRHIPYEVRGACELLGHTLSLLIGAREDADEFSYCQRLDDLQDRLVEAMGQGASVSSAFQNPQIDLLSPLGADGFALIVNGEVQRRGQAPSQEQILRLAASLAERPEAVWHTDQLAQEFEYAKDFPAAGVLAARIARRQANYAMWFRGEYARTVKWAGDPAKVTMENNAQRLAPRGSFALWQTEAAGKSKPWRECEELFAAQLRHAIVEVILETNRQHDSMAARIARGQNDLDAYLALASHDLKEPLRGIHNYSQLLARSAKDRLTITELAQLNSVANLAQRMDHMIENLLGYSRTANAGARLEELNSLNICRETIALIQGKAGAGADVEFEVHSDLPALKTDPDALQQIFYHLITNAIQYNVQAKKVIEIGAKPAQTPTFFVRDNGIGIPAENREDVFKLFRRLHRRDEFGGGIGAGLAAVRRLVEQLHGRIWIESAVGEGSTFYFTIGDECD